MKLVLVDKPHVIWPEVKHHIRKAMDRGIGGFEDIEWDVLHDRALLWIAWAGGIHGVAITQLTEKDGQTNCTIVACGGEGFKDWVHLIEGLEDYARSEGATLMRIIGRRGWQRILPDYRVKSVTLERVL